MRKLTDNDITNHIKEINNYVTHVNFDKICSYERRQMVANQFDNIIQGMFDADPSYTFPLSCYFFMDWYTDYAPVCPDAQEQIASIVMTTNPFIDLLTLDTTLRDHLVSLLTSKRLNYWQQLCEFQYACKDAEEYKTSIANFTT